MHKAIVFWGLCAILLFVPLPIGSVDEWAISVFEAATLLLFLVYLGGGLLARRRRERGESEQDGSGAMSAAHPAGVVDGRLGAIPLAVKILLAVFLVCSVVQLLPLPPALVRLVSPRAAAIYQGLARDGLAGWEARPFWPLSLSPRVSAGELVLIVCYGLFGFLVLRTVRSRRRVETFILVVFAAALFQAFYGMAETFSGSEKIFAAPKKYNIGSVTGTFVNRNHLAGFLEMAFPLSLGYLLAKGRFFLMERGLGWRRKLLWFSQESLQGTLILGLGTVLIGLALVFTKSRSGALIFLVTLLLAAAAFGGWRELSDGADDRRRMRGLLRLVGAVVVAVALWLGIGPVIERFGEMDVTKEMRRTFIANTVRMTGDFLWAGAGKGTYVDVYPMYKKVDDGFLLSYAHNDYLEVLAENGVIAGGCLIAAAVWLFAWLVGWWRKRRDNFAKGVGLGALLGILALLLHGFTDFNLQIPANAVYFVGLYALAVNVVVRRGEGEGGESGGGGPASDAAKTGPAAGRSGASGGGSGRKSIRAGRLTLLKASALGGAAVALLVFAFRDFCAFHGLGLYQDARAEARSVQSAFPALERLLDDAVGWSAHPAILKERGRLELEMARAENDSARGERRDLACDKAAASYAADLARDPIDSSAHYETGMTYLLYNYPLMTYADKAKLYFREALELNPADEFLNLNILYYYLTAWDGLDAAERAYVGGRLKRIRTADPGFRPQLEQRWKSQFGSTDGLTALLRTLE